MSDFFEIERLVEDLAKIYSTACATSWYKVTNISNPTIDEFRNKVIEFMKHFEYTLSTFPHNNESENFKKYAMNLLVKEIERVLNGENKEVEKRYKYFVDYIIIHESIFENILNIEFKCSLLTEQLFFARFIPLYLII